MTTGRAKPPGHRTTRRGLEPDTTTVGHAATTDSDATRPTLAEHVAARRYLRRGDPAIAALSESVVLHDTRGTGIAVLGRREWQLLRCADGTRDAVGIRLAARHRGVRVAEADLNSFLAGLARAGLLRTESVPPAEKDARGDDDLVRPSDVGPSDDARWVPPRPEAPLLPLPGFALRCDGRGSCCRIFGSTLFSPAEVTRAAGLCPEVLGRGWGTEPLFTPVSGSTYRLEGGAERAACVASVEGACAYLATNGQCALHAAAGPLAKPLGCRSFPRELVDDGDCVLVSVAPECACVMRSLSGEPGEPLVSPTARTGADLDPSMLVRLLREPVEVVPEKPVSTSRYLHWARELAAWIAPAWQNPGSTRPVDSLAWSWGTAQVLESRGELTDVRGLDHLRAPGPTELAPSLRALEREIDTRLERWRPWRAPGDLSMTTALWLRAAIAWLATADRSWPLRATPAIHRREAFCLHAWLHGHRLVEEGPIVAALRDVSVRFLLARTMAASVSPPCHEGPLGEVCDEPLALVHAWFRAHGLAAHRCDPAGQ